MKLRRLSLALVVILLLATVRAENHNTYPLPEERGTAGILGALEKLPVYVRVLETTAHPDDENAGTLTWLSRKIHARTALFSLTRGAGGQNILGSEKYMALSVVRTGELLEACRFYGVELYFSTAYDFGFSKDAEETLSKWGHEATLEEMVRFIRRWRPTIIISRFQGNPGDGHGHHQAAGIITKEAFRAAADPHQFPEQLKLGILPWQAGKLFTSAGRVPVGSSSNGTAGEVVRVPVGDYDPVLGRSYREIAAEGYSEHRSQGNGEGYALPGQAYDRFRLIDSAIENRGGGSGLFDSIDTSLSAIADLAGTERATVPFLQADLAEAHKFALEALQNFRPRSPADAADAVFKGAAVLTRSIQRVGASSLSVAAKEMVTDALNEKLEDFRKAADAALGIYLVVQAQDVDAAPGTREPVTAYFYNRGPYEIDLEQLTLGLPKSWVSSPAENEPKGRIRAGGSAVFHFTVEIPAGAGVTQPFWYLPDIRSTRYSTHPADDVFAPFDKPRITATATYRFHDGRSEISAPARAQAGDPIRGSDFVDLQVVPELSVTLMPDFGISPFSSEAQTRPLHVSILNSGKAEASGTVRLSVPKGWRTEPAQASFALSRKGETASYDFVVHIPGKTQSGTYPIEAVATAGGKEFRRGYQVISYPENWTRNLYSPSRSDLEIFDVKVAPDLTVGYVMGSGDDIPPALQQLGVKVQMLSDADLALRDLSGFAAIITGIRAYNVDEGLRANNRRLLQYVEQGGNLIVQYNRPLGRPAQRGGGAPFPYGPYPMSDSDAARITVEESPVTILDPSSPVFTTPNRITADDFKGWVQERGAYFMTDWDPHYTPLLSGHDPGESPLNGGMLLARYGKGYYVYTAYSWFRQLPAGVPGAYRIFANLLSLGKK